jgi:NAD+ synthase (glutamine-hydrolysing)
VGGWKKNIKKKGGSIMKLINVGIANSNATVGAFRSNTDQILKLALQASKQRLAVVVYPEGIIGGYSPEDLLDWSGFTEGQWEELRRFTAATGDMQFPTVHLVGLFLRHQGENYNAVAAVCHGKLVGGILKENLPTYNVFYEGRKCSRGREGLILDVFGHPFGDVLFRAPFGLFSADDCEDIWRADGPLMRRAYNGSLINFTSNASPFRFGVLETRREMLATRSADNVAVEVYGNLVGGNDGLIFDGGGFVFSNGRPVYEAPRWSEGLHTAVVDLEAVETARAQHTTWRQAKSEFLSRTAPTRILEIPWAAAADETLHLPVPSGKNFFMPSMAEAQNPEQAFFEELEQALVLGTKDYITKTGVFEVLGNAGSGGKDSALTTII